MLTWLCVWLWTTALHYTWWWCSSFAIEDDHDFSLVRSAEKAMSAEATEESDPGTTVFPAGWTCVLGAESKNTSGSRFPCSVLLRFVQSSGLCTVSSTGNPCSPDWAVFGKYFPRIQHKSVLKPPLLSSTIVTRCSDVVHPHDITCASDAFMR